jgi:concanavalin A-like lectin/glucanase superfamily protein
VAVVTGTMRGDGYMSRLVRGAAGAAALSVVVGLALVPAGVASAQTNLLPNPTFSGGTTSGWKGTNATLSVVSPGFDTSTDNYAANVKLSNTSTSYAIYASPRPATSVAAGTQLQGTGEVLGVSGKSICLMLQEYTSGGSLVRTQSKCVTASGSWQPIGPAALTDKNTGDSVGFRIRQTGAVAGNSFQADALSLTESALAPPPAVTGNVGDWPMQETSGTTAQDISPTLPDDNGTLVGPVQVGQPGPGGSTGLAYAYSFPGSSAPSTVDVPNAAKLVAGSQNIDISFWFNTTYLPSSGDFDLVRMGDYPYPEYKVELYPQNNIQCTFHGSSSSNHTTGGSNLANATWHFVQCVKTASQIQLWIDGAEVGATNAVIGDVSPSQDAFFGAHGQPGTSAGFDWYHGELADVEFSFG